MTEDPVHPDRHIVLTGGVGGAKLVQGLAAVLPEGTLTAIVNTGDDFDHLGLRIWPDFDTTLYTLSGVVNRDQGWGRADERWTALTTLGALGGEDWFRLGDRDLAVHLLRTGALRTGTSPVEIAKRLTAAFALSTKLLPATEDIVSTKVTTPQGVLDFQHYFVRERCAPRISAIRYDGAERAQPAPVILEALQDPALRSILLAPSNPLLSMGPILAIQGLRDGLARAKTPRIAISPIVGGRAVKGPTAKIMTELHMEVSPLTVARLYRDILDGFILDTEDKDLRQSIEALGLRCLVTNTVMTTDAERAALARTALDFAADLVPHRAETVP